MAGIIVPARVESLLADRSRCDRIDLACPPKLDCLLDVLARRLPRDGRFFSRANLDREVAEVDDLEIAFQVYPQKLRLRAQRTRVTNDNRPVSIACGFFRKVPLGQSPARFRRRLRR